MSAADKSEGDDLIEAYHTIYDTKDRHMDDDKVRMLCFHALRHLDTLMSALGVTKPDRFDGQGRTQ